MLKDPQEYIDLLHEFVQTEHRGVQIGGATREDWVALTMAAHALHLPVHVRNTKGSIYLMRIVAEPSE